MTFSLSLKNTPSRLLKENRYGRFFNFVSPNDQKKKKLARKKTDFYEKIRVNVDLLTSWKCTRLSIICIIEDETTEPV